MASEIQLPMSLGRYELFQRLAGGGQGAIYLANDRGLNRVVVVKVPHIRDATVIKRFLQEGAAAGRVSHPLVCRVYDVGEDKGFHYLVMEYVRGEPLSKHLARGGPFKAHDAIKLVRMLAQALQAVHNEGIIHRDIKPDNVIMRKDESGKYVPTLVDFGLALDTTATRRTTMLGVGTPVYMAPEQIDDTIGRIGPATDVYSLGMLFYELLTKINPFRGERISETLAKVLQTAPPKPSTFHKGPDSAGDDICLRCLQKRPEDRFPSMKALEQALSAELQKPEPSVQPVVESIAPALAVEMNLQVQRDPTRVPEMDDKTPGSWKVRHEGSPKHVEGLTPEEVLQGLLDTQFEPTDEVQGPGETTWTALENHPQFAEAAAEIEAPPPRVYDDETRLDMNALIDVCLVLLIFFILTTVYASQELLLEAAGGHSEQPGAVRLVDQKKADEAMAHMTLKKSAQGDGIVVRVVTKKAGEKEVALEISRSDASDKQRLIAFRDKLRDGIAPLTEAGFRTMMIEFLSDQIPHEVAVAVKDGARAAGITEVLYKVE